MVGTYTIYVSDLDCNFNSKFHYDESLQDYTVSRAINGSGRIQDDRKAPEILIDGRSDLNQQMLYFSVYPEGPYPLINTEERQTRREMDFPRQTVVTKIIGTLAYQRGDQPELKSGLYAAIFAGELQFEELWTCAKVGRKIERFIIEIFGNAMLQVQNTRIITYHWS